MKERKPVATEETRKKLQQAFQKLKEKDATPFVKSNEQQNDKDEE